MSQTKNIDESSWNLDRQWNTCFEIYLTYHDCVQYSDHRRLCMPILHDLQKCKAELWKMPYPGGWAIDRKY